MSQHAAISLEQLLYSPRRLREGVGDGWDDFDIDPKTGKLVRKATAKPQPVEQPDEPGGGALGKYVFGDLRREILHQNIEAEPDTALEKKLFAAITSYISSNDKAGMNSISSDLLDISKSDKYKEIFTVNASQAWRVLINLDRAALEKIIAPNQIPVEKKTGVLSGITLQPVAGSTFSGWTTDPNTLARIYSQATIMDGGENTDREQPRYVAVAVCKPADGNDFFLSIDALSKYLSAAGNPYAYQKEVLAYGPVKTALLAWKLLDPKTLTNPIPAMATYLQSKAPNTGT